MNARPSFRKRPRRVILDPLALTRFAVIIANKGLTRILSSLDATLTKNKGAAIDGARHSRIAHHES
jgi:hypothetical protein